MIDLHTWPTPNGFKVSIMLEETALPYTVLAIDISKGDQFDPEFLRISPNNKMPAIVDRDGLGAVSLPGLRIRRDTDVSGGKDGPIHARTHGGPVSRHPMADVPDGRHRPDAGTGPPFPPIRVGPHPLRHRTLHERGAPLIYSVMDRRLEEVPYLAGDYSIADMACFPWLRSHQRQGQRLEDFPAVKRWFEAIAPRPAVQRGLRVLADRRRPSGEMNTEERSVLFGDKQYAQR